MLPAALLELLHVSGIMHVPNCSFLSACLLGLSSNSV